MNSQAGGIGGVSEGPASRDPLESSAPLIGNVGQEYVQLTLSTNDPVAAIADIQARASLRDPRCRPLLGLLDQLGLPRAESHRYVAQRAVKVLLERLPSLSPDSLLSLLEETFPYITLPELRAVPLAALDRLRPVPATFLKQLAADREVFWELPLGVQRQAWELDRKLLQTHAMSLVEAYTYETATWMQGLNMDSSSSTSSIPATRAVPQLARRILRNGSAALRQLVAMVGSNAVVYRGIVDLCTARYRDSEAAFVGMKDAALCALRSQLLMALHDAGNTDICSADPCHKLAWTLDACLKDRGFDQRRLEELENFFSGFPNQAPTRAKSARASAGASDGSRPRSAKRRVRDDDAESAGVPGAASIEDPLRELGAAAMVLRDPATFHLMLHEVVRCLEACVASESVPKKDPQLRFISRLLTTAVGGREMLQEGEFYLPEPNPEVMDTLYPLVADFILDAELAEEGDEAAAEPPPEALMDLLGRDEIGRRVVQTYALKRLAAGDMATGQRVLQAIAESLNAINTQAIPEFAPFAFTLARRMASLLASGDVAPSHPIWSVAVDGILLQLVDSETEAHEEVLRLLLAAVPQLDPATLGAQLATTLANSHGSRRAHKKRAAHAAELPPPGYGDATGGWGEGGYEGSETEWHAFGGYGEGDVSKSGKGADGVRGTYALFACKAPGLDVDTAPELFDYLESTQSES